MSTGGLSQPDVSPCTKTEIKHFNIQVWHREDSTLPPSAASAVNSRGVLSIEAASPRDEGIYVCEAQNEAGTISVSASLSVHG